MRVALLFLLMLCALPSMARHAGRIDHLEPANWWIGMRHHRVELMVHGQGIATLTPRLTHPGVAIVDVQTTGNPNYLFVTVDISTEARPGTFNIEFLDGPRVVATHPWRLDAREAGSTQRRGFDARDAIYLLMPDRFANGDAANDRVDEFLRGHASAIDVMRGTRVVLGDRLQLPGKSATILQLE